jgi:hypothetical protein
MRETNTNYYLPEKLQDFKAKPTRMERRKYIRRIVGDSQSVAKRMILVINCTQRNRCTVLDSNGGCWNVSSP